MFSAKIKLEKSLYDRVARAGERAGYSSTDEFVTHVLEKAVSDLQDESSDEEVQKQLRGLGYIE
ncbi:MAG: hypothetical protein IH888_11410 [Planctomycetes bacterium]|nr:hypothetical protein [Planctomycetota bacterium]